MDPSRPAEAPSPTPETLEFVRFCYRRRRVGWPELYDEMCAVAGRGLYRGWRFSELEAHGIGFSLNQTLELARLAGQVAHEEGDRRGRGAAPAGPEPAAGSVDPGPVVIAGSGTASPNGIRARGEECSFDVRIVSAAPDAEPVASTAPGGGAVAVVPSVPAPARVAVPMETAPSARLGPAPAGPAIVPSLITSAVIAG